MPPSEMSKADLRKAWEFAIVRSQVPGEMNPVNAKYLADVFAEVEKRHMVLGGTWID